MAEPSGIALELVQSQLLNELFDKMEHDAKERAISAPSGDDEMRLFSAMEVKAIRSVRKELKSLANGKTNRRSTGAVA